MSDKVINAANSRRKKVFVVYHTNKQQWIEKYVLRIFEEHSIHTNLLHTGRIPGENLFNAITRAIEDPDVRILAIFSPDFLSCPYCAFFNENLKACVSQEGKVIPMCIEGCDPPKSMVQFAYLRESDKFFSRKLVRAIDWDLVQASEQYSPPRCEHAPRLAVKQKPAGEIRAFPRTKRKFFKSTMKCEYDHKVVLQQDIRYSKSMAVDTLRKAGASFHTEVRDIYIYGPDDEAIPEVDGLVRVLPDQPSGVVSVCEATFLVRVMHPPQVQTVKLSIRFDLIESNARSTSTEVVDSCWVTLVTKTSCENNSKTDIKRKNLKTNQKWSVATYDAGSEGERKRDSDPEVKDALSKVDDLKVETNSDSAEMSLEKHYEGNDATGENTNIPSADICRVLANPESGSICERIVINTETARRIVPIHLKAPQRFCQQNAAALEAECSKLMIHLDTLSEGSTADYNRLTVEGKHMLDYYGNQNKFDIQGFICTKLIGAAHYRNDLRSAKLYLQRLDSFLPKCKYWAEMSGKALIYKTAIYREKSIFGKAEDTAIQAVNVLQDMQVGLDLATAYFNFGKYYMKRLETIHKVGPDVNRKKALEQFELAMDCYKRTNPIDFSQVRRCLLNMARVCVGCPMIRIQHFRATPNAHIVSHKFLETGLLLTDKDTEKAREYLRKLKGYGPMGGVSKRNKMQTLYAEAEITFIEALFSFKSDNRRNDTFYEGIGSTITMLQDACDIAQEGNYKEHLNLTMFIKCLEAIYNQFKSRYIKVVTSEGSEVVYTGSSDAATNQSEQTKALYTSGFENLSSSSGFQSSESTENES